MIERGLGVNELVEVTVDTFYASARRLYENGNFGGFQRTEVLRRERHGGREFGFRNGMAYVSGEDERTPRFEIYKDVVLSLRSEFSSFLDKHLGEGRSPEDELVKYLSSTALGNMLYNDIIFGSRFPRTEKRVDKIKEIHADRSSLLQGIVEVVPSEAEREVYTFVTGYLTDETLIRVNGIRTGQALFRSLAMSDCESRAEDEGGSLVHHEALISHVLKNAGDYESMGAGFSGSRSNGLKSLAFFIPEWLFVCAFPMEPSKIEVLLEK